MYYSQNSSFCLGYLKKCITILHFLENEVAHLGYQAPLPHSISKFEENPEACFLKVLSLPFHPEINLFASWLHLFFGVC